MRYYEPSICRWITTDPAGFSDGPNLYAYVHGNPLRYYDPYGLWSMEGAMESVRDFCSDLFSGSNDDGSMSGGDVAMAGGLVLAAPAFVIEGSAAGAVFAAFEIGVAAVYTGKALYGCVCGDRLSKGEVATPEAVAAEPDSVSEPSVNESIKPKKGKRQKNWMSDIAEPGSVEWNKPKTGARKYGDDGWVELEYNEGHQGEKTPEVEREDHVHDWTPNPYHPQGRPTRQDGRTPTEADYEIFGIKGLIKGK